MNDLDLAWLIPTILEVTGLAIGLGILGLAYERAARERKPFGEEVTRGQSARWLVVASVIFAVGMCFTEMGWGYKTIAVTLAALLIGLAWASPQTSGVEVSETAKPKITKKSPGKRWIKILIGAVVVLVVAWGMHLSWHTVHLVRMAENLQGDLTQIQPDSIVGLIGEAADDIGAIHQDLKPLLPVFKAMQWIPGAGAYLGQVEPLVRYADGLAQAGKEISLGLKPLLEETPAGQMALSLPERASQAVQSGQDHFVKAAEAIDLASQMRGRIQAELLPGLVRPLYLKLDGKFELLAAGVQVLQAAPKLLGAGQAQNYLVLAQNRDELRATGGFISGIGLMTIQDGKILRFDLGDSYAIDDFSKGYPTPPEPLKRFMLADYWVTRDANWSPDFPTSSQEAQALYTLSTGVQTQGVIAFNQLAVQRILEVIGPVQVPGTEELVTAENVVDYMRQSWAPAPEEGLSQEWWLHRKDFMQQLGSVILEKAMSTGNQEQVLNLAKTMVELLDQGQLLVHFNEPTAQAALEEGGWNGAVRPGSSDYLYLVDSNVGFNKVDSVIQRSLTYQVDLSDLNYATGVVTLTYQHKGSGDPACKQIVSYGNGTYQDMQQRCYLDYWRVYVPGGSKLLESTAQPVPAEELLNGVGWPGQVESLTGEAGTQVLAGLLMLPPAQSSQTYVSYSLPPGIVQQTGTNLHEYVLRVQVQPGLEGLPFRLEIKLPDKASLLNPGEGWKPQTAQTWTWQGILDKSTELSLTIQTSPNQ